MTWGVIKCRFLNVYYYALISQFSICYGGLKTWVKILFSIVFVLYVRRKFCGSEATHFIHTCL